MRQLKLVVQYDGTDYFGFQVQPNVPTIQRDLERALAAVLGHEVRITVASRTDAGVHALGNVIAVRTDRPIPVDHLVRAVNAALPAAISLVEGMEVPGEFHPRRDAVGKLYIYRLLNRALPSPFIGRYAWHVQAPLDAQLMAEAASLLLGRHDFSAFEAAGSEVPNKVRRIVRLDCTREGDIIEIRVHADGFLYRMVRNIVGTLVEVGRGRLAPAAVRDILQSRDRSQAGPTAPPHGLCLVRVDY